MRRTRLLVGLVILLGLWGIAIGRETALRLSYEPPAEPVIVGFVATENEPYDDRIPQMVDQVIEQVLGPKGLASIISPGDRVVIKTNNVQPNFGIEGEKGRGVITDPRIVRHVAEEVRRIIGFDNGADLKVVDATFDVSPDPSNKESQHSFYWARLERTGDNLVNEGDITYDIDGDGILDGTSSATLVNLDSILPDQRYSTMVDTISKGAIDISYPKWLRTREEAIAAGEPDEYCDVFIGLPILKSHSFAGMTGAIKLHYGFLWYFARFGHNDASIDRRGNVTNGHLLDEFMVAQHRVRTYDFVLMDCLTGNRAGPSGPDQNKPDDPVDYILTNALLASTDSVAIDMVASLLGGYKPESIDFLKHGRLYGVGEDQPQHIRVMGEEAFSRHRQLLYDRYSPQDLYPFREGWGDAQLMTDYSPPTNVGGTIAFDDAGAARITWTAEENAPNDTGLARVDVIVDGRVVAWQNDNPAASGTIELRPGLAVPGQSVRLAAWDMALNCTLSDNLDVAALPSR